MARVIRLALIAGSPAGFRLHLTLHCEAAHLKHFGIFVAGDVRIGKGTYLAKQESGATSICVAGSADGYPGRLHCTPSFELGSRMHSINQSLKSSCPASRPGATAFQALHPFNLHPSPPLPTQPPAAAISALLSCAGTLIQTS